MIKKIIQAISLLWIVAAAIVPQNAETAINYTLTTIPYAPAIPFPATSGTQITFTDCDDGYANIDIPFTFNFYGVDYTDLYVGTNGFLTFGNGETSYIPQRIPYSSFPASIFGFWADLYLCDSGTVYYDKIDEYPNRQFVISFNAVPHTDSSATVTMQMVLKETSNEIEFYIQGWTGLIRHLTQGIQNQDGTMGVAIPGRNQSEVPANFNAQEGYLFTTRLPTTTTLTSAPNPSQVGKKVTFTATISPNPGTGTVSFYDNNTLIGTAPIISGIATFNTKALTQGFHSITAFYQGNGTYAPSTSNALVQQSGTPPIRLFGTTVEEDANSMLVELDPNTGAFFRNIGLTGYNIAGGLAWDPTTQTLFAIDSYEGYLLKINVNTGAATPIGSTFGSSDVVSLTCNSVGQLYAWNLYPSELVTINKNNGTLSDVGLSGIDTYEVGMDFDKINVLRLLNGDNGNIYTINTSTGSATVTSNSPVYPYSLGINGKFHPVTGLFWGINISYPTPVGIAVFDFSTVPNATVQETLPTVDNLQTLAFIPRIDPPANLNVQCVKICPLGPVNEITGSAPLAGLTPTSYNIYSDPGLKNLIGTAHPNASGGLRFIDYKGKCSRSIYYIVSLNGSLVSDSAVARGGAKRCR